ncbi:MAG: TRAP transporter small permease [Rhodobiaceae bacterium]|nr:TRAP transporter small permease [Rhodobiaceae bacterium]
MQLIDRIIKLFENVVCTATLGVIIVLVLVQVFYRYVLSSGILWIDELVINLMVLLVLVGAALATRRGLHTALEMIVDIAPGPLPAVMKVIRIVGTAAFVLVLIYASAQYAWESRRLSTTMIGIPLWLAYGVIPLGGVLIFYEMAKSVIGALRQGRIDMDTSA